MLSTDSVGNPCVTANTPASDTSQWPRWSVCVSVRVCVVMAAVLVLAASTARTSSSTKLQCVRSSVVSDVAELSRRESSSGPLCE
jgi:hypothetical protein